MENTTSNDTYTNADDLTKSNSSNEIIERKEIENTPFTAIKVDEKGWFLTMGRHRLTEPYGTIEGLEAMVGSVDWDMLLTIINIFVESSIEAREGAEKEKQAEKLNTNQ